MRWGAEVPQELSKLLLPADATLLDALRVIDEGAEAIAFVCDSDGRVVGSLSDGDIRRAILSGAPLESACLTEVMRRDFAFATPAMGRAEVLDIMRARDIGQLPVLDAVGRLRGLHTIGQIIATRKRDNWAVILAGGRGTRLAPYTESVPKPMLRVAGRPILERLVLHLMSHGIDRVFLSVNYLADIVESHFGDGSGLGCRIEYLRESKPLGTGGPLGLLDPPPTTPVLVINGDLVTDCDIGQLIDFHEQGQYEATFAVRPHSVQIPFGVADVDGDRLLAVREKPTHRMLINAGMYVLSPAIVSMVGKDQELPITDLFSRCIEAGLKVGAHVIDQEWADIGRHDELARARGEA